MHFLAPNYQDFVHDLRPSAHCDVNNFQHGVRHAALSALEQEGSVLSQL